jgi:hypothetical protein
MPRQPCLCVLITRGTQLHAEPLGWLSCIALGGGWWRTCAASSFLTGPLTTGWATHCTSCWGLCSLAWQEGMGYHLSRVRLRGLRPPTTFMLTAAGLWQQSVLQRGGAVNRCWCDGGGGHPPSSGGGGFTANQRLPATAPPSVVGSGRGTFRVLSSG